MAPNSQPPHTLWVFLMTSLLLTTLLTLVQAAAVSKSTSNVQGLSQDKPPRAWAGPETDPSATIFHEDIINKGRQTIDLIASSRGEQDGLEWHHLEARADLQTHVKRVTPLYTAAVARGVRMLALLDDTPRCADKYQSKFTDINDMVKNGWTKGFERDQSTSSGDQGAQKAVQIIGGENTWRKIVWTHDSSGGSYSQGYQLNSHAVICFTLYSPRSAGLSDYIPDLNRWSDATFLQWQELTRDNGQIDRLRYVVHTGISNDDTLNIIDQVAGGSLPGGSRVLTFEPGSENFKALLGTPNVVGTAYLLGEHKRQLGWKTISSVKVFKLFDDASRYRQEQGYTMIIEIEPHPQAAASGTERRADGQGRETNETDEAVRELLASLALA